MELVGRSLAPHAIGTRELGGSQHQTVYEVLRIKFENERSAVPPSTG